jgi:hypothetical protein
MIFIRLNRVEIQERPDFLAKAKINNSFIIPPAKAGGN